MNTPHFVSIKCAEVGVVPEWPHTSGLVLSCLTGGIGPGLLGNLGVTVMAFEDRCVHCEHEVCCFCGYKKLMDGVTTITIKSTLEADNE